MAELSILYEQCEAMARRVVPEGSDPRAIALLAEQTCAELGQLPSLTRDLFPVLFGIFDTQENASVDIKTLYVAPAELETVEPPPTSVAANLKISRALAVDIEMLERLWKLGKTGRAEAKDYARFITSRTGSNSPIVQTLWEQWIPRLEAPGPLPEPSDAASAEDWKQALLHWGATLRTQDMPPVMALAEALWQARVRFMVEARPGGIVTGLHSDVITVMGRQTEMPLGESVVRDAKGREVADIVLVDASITEQMVRAGADLFGSLAGHKLINFVVLEAAERDALAEAGQLIRPDDLHIDGGMAGLCELLGLPTAGPNREMLRNILRAGACLHWRTKVMDQQGSGWWGWNETIGRGRRKGELMITALAPLRPGFAAYLSNRKQGRSADRKLVPELRHAPPLLSVRRNERGKVYTFGRLAVSSLVEHADQLPDGVKITDADWRNMADTAGLPLEIAPRVVDGFIAGDDESPPLLKRDGDRYTLSDAHPVERQHIEALGGLVRRSRKNGRKGAAKRGGNGKK